MACWEAARWTALADGNSAERVGRARIICNRRGAVWRSPFLRVGCRSRVVIPDFEWSADPPNRGSDFVCSNGR
jgi:hypothetical protein